MVTPRVHSRGPYIYISRGLTQLHTQCPNIYLHGRAYYILGQLVQETRAQIWPNLAPEYICRFMIDCLSPDSSLFKSAGCQTVNFGQLILFAFEKKK